MLYIKVIKLSHLFSVLHMHTNIMSMYMAMTSSKPLNVVRSFYSVAQNFVDRPLVICDIDHTLFRCSKPLHHYTEFLQKLYSERYRFPVNVEEEALNLMHRAYCDGFIQQTDPAGFRHMVERIEELGGRIVFLTARNIYSHARTLEDFRKVGFEHPETFDIHYTNNVITKGDYIKCMQLDSGFDHVYFIDDQHGYLESVQRECPHIHCFQFQYKY